MYTHLSASHCLVTKDLQAGKLQGVDDHKSRAWGMLCISSSFADDTVVIPFSYQPGGESCTSELVSTYEINY